MEARQRVKLTGTNRSLDLIALIAKARAREARSGQTTDNRGRITSLPSCPPDPVLLHSEARARRTEDGQDSRSVLCSLSSVLRFLPAWWPLQGDKDPIPSRTRPSNALAPMVLCLKTWESRPSPGLQRTDNRRRRTEDRSKSPPRRRFLFKKKMDRRRTIPICPPSSALSPPIAAGWSSPVARQAHNLKAAGSNPAPATTPKSPERPLVRGFLICRHRSWSRGRSPSRSSPSRRLRPIHDAQVLM